MSRLASILLPLAFLLQSAESQKPMSVIHTLSSLEQPDYSFGRSVAFIGDVSGDGVADILIGDSGFRACVFSGKTGALLRTLGSPSEEVGDFGFSVAGLADVTGDNVSDLIVGAPAEDSGASAADAGRSYVFCGVTGTVAQTLISPHEEESGRFGHAVAGVDDVDGDGIDDLIVGAPYENPGTSPPDAGRVYVFSGATGMVIRELVSPGEIYGQAGGHFGASVCGAGDLDGDGTPDVVVGAPGEHPPSGELGPGRVYAFSGAIGLPLWTGASLDLEDGGGFGLSISMVGDIDGNGISECLVGAPFEDDDWFIFNCGRAYILSGAAGTAVRIVQPPYGERDGQFGFSVSCAGDIDGDGCSDYIVGALLEGLSPEGEDWIGRAHVFSGASGEAVWSLDSPNPWYGGSFGIAVAGGFDVTGDGVPEVIVGAPGENPARAYVYGPEMVLNGQVEGGALALSWTPVVGAFQYWVYGAENAAYCLPGMAPGYEDRLVVLPPSTESWSSSHGIGDPNSNWAYVILAVSSTESELCRSGRAGEHDFDVGYLP
ncbi:FG-GAP repeat protein [Candidatus Fermentibacteria bacterium]|nr:FG-GAP repeat protein [Candidatus Fermentibacteria bacterium]